MNCIYYYYFGVDSNALSLVSCIFRHGCDVMAGVDSNALCIFRHGCDAMAIECQIETENRRSRPLGSVCHNEQDKSD